MEVQRRHNVHTTGPEGAPTMVLAHGFGCDQSMWRFVAPRFATDYRVVLFDHAGCGASDPSSYDPVRHAALDGYAQDLVELVEHVADGPAVVVGHSVSAMIAVLAAAERPDLFDGLVLVGPSPRYVDADGYRGGFTAEEIDELLQTMDSNYLGWSRTMAPVIAGNPDRPEVGAELTNLFCRTDPAVARRFARATFLADNREDLARVRTPSIVVQSREDVIAPPEVGRYVHEHLPGSELAVIDAVGHCPNLSHPEELVRAMDDWLRSR
ncbi:alpha/beta fold hydrolase [Cellulosimicrobium sp. NPDC057127]|uniref:alpha/beta fold hydrolase n=1 Tax=Cellulosimicrobium sp. NPDC057127 TaxID=3346026 RepID=UPI00363E086C